MNKYDFGPKTRQWLSKRIGDHFDGRPTGQGRGLAGPLRYNKNLRLILQKPVYLSVYDGEDLVRIKINAGSELVAFHSADFRHGKIAAIFDRNGSQYTFHGDSQRLVCRTADDLNGRELITVGRSRSRSVGTE